MWGEERIIEGQETGEIISHLVFTAIPNPEPETATNNIQPRSTHVSTSTVWLARNLMFILKDDTNSLHRHKHGL